MKTYLSIFWLILINLLLYIIWNFNSFENKIYWTSVNSSNINTTSLKEESWEVKRPTVFTTRALTPTNSISLLSQQKVTQNYIWTIHEYTWPNDLFYWFHKKDWPYIYQSYTTHYRRNWRLAQDIVFSTSHPSIYAPAYKWKEIEYTVSRIYSFDYWDWVILEFEEEGANYYWIFWHTTLNESINDWIKVKTWDILWTLNLTWITEWYHLHVELWQWTNQVLYEEKSSVLNERKRKNILK